MRMWAYQESWWLGSVIAETLPTAGSSNQPGAYRMDSSWTTTSASMRTTMSAVVWERAVLSAHAFPWWPDPTTMPVAARKLAMTRLASSFVLSVEPSSATITQTGPP